MEGFFTLFSPFNGFTLCATLFSSFVTDLPRRPTIYFEANPFISMRMEPYIDEFNSHFGKPVFEIKDNGYEFEGGDEVLYDLRRSLWKNFHRDVRGGKNFNPHYLTERLSSDASKKVFDFLFNCKKGNGINEICFFDDPPTI